MYITLSKLIAVFIYPSGLILILGLLGLCLFLAQRARAAQKALAAALLVFLIAANPLVAGWLLNSLEKDFPPLNPNSAPYADIIVLLGGGLGLPLPPRKTPQLVSGSDRLWQAAQLYNAGRAPYLLIAGGNVFSAPGFEAEAHYSAEVLTAWGVPREKILIESRSRTTQQNAENIAPMLNTLNARKILLVTSAYHMRRSIRAFRKQLSNEVEIIPASADVLVTHNLNGNAPSLFSYLPHPGAFSGTQRALHEYFGILYYWLNDWLDQ
jgi:uncharacterized SAM-binding protein YcdF (DUF218 family)